MIGSDNETYWDERIIFGGGVKFSPYRNVIYKGFEQCWSPAVICDPDSYCEEHPTLCIWEQSCPTYLNIRQDHMWSFRIIEPVSGLFGSTCSGEGSLISAYQKISLKNGGKKQ